MPKEIQIDLPLIILPRGGLTLVRPIGFPEIAMAAGKEEIAVAKVRRRVLESCKGRVGSELVLSLVRGEPKQQSVTVEIAPPSRSDAWREPVETRMDAFVWQQGDALVISYTPALDLTVVATPQADLQSLVQEQIRSAIRRRGAWSLSGLASLDRSEAATLIQQPISVAIATPTEHAREDDKPTSKTPTLQAVATRLKRGTVSRAFHRDSEVRQLGQLLASVPARSVLLVGPSGVGKTAIFHQWVRQRGEFAMRAVQCWATDGSRLISGQSGFGMWQQQCLQLAEEARKYPSVIHLGNLAELSESGRLRGSGGCGSLLAPRLADGSLRAVIECTPEQLTRVQRAEPRLVASLTMVRIAEPTPEQTRSILLEAATQWRPIDVADRLRKSKRKRRRGPRDRPAAETLPMVDPEALQLLDRLHRRFRTDAASPGRLLAFFHAAMSELDAGRGLDAAEVIAAFGRQTGLPKFLVDTSVRPDLVSIERQLKSQVIGQDQVIEILVDMIATLAADLARGDRPLASLMLIGPTGVGKTETAKALARLIYSDVSRLVRIDMSELATPSAVGRLIGDAAHPEGILTSAVRAQPFSLVLLDEFEKAHHSVFDLLLQVLGEGRLTDGRGRLADFRNSIVLMTSNLGVESFKAVPLGLAETQHRHRYASHFERHLRDFLRPEMFNRIDRILTYQPLDQSIVEKIARVRLRQLRDRDGWKGRGDLFEVDEEALRELARHGYQAQYGARPLAREIEQRVAAPLSEAICNSGRLTRLTAHIGVTEPTKPTDSSLSVRVKANEPGPRRAGDSVEDLIEQMTLLRRRSQALQRCEAVRRRRNQHTILSRRIKSMIRATRDDKKKNKIRFGPQGVHRRQLWQELHRIDLLCSEIMEAESDILAQYYRDEPVAMTSTSDSLESLHQRLWETLCQLHSETGLDNQTMTLIITGPNLVAAKSLLEAYRYVAMRRDWIMITHALLRRDPNSGTDRPIECDGWEDMPVFRVGTRAKSSDGYHPDRLTNPKSSSESSGGARSGSGRNQGRGSSDKPVLNLAAYRLARPSALSTLPGGTLGVMMSFRGKLAALAMGAEKGVHTFQLSRQADSVGVSVLVQAYRGKAIDYVAPHELLRRDMPVTGLPRRWYDLENDLVQDMVESDGPPVKKDREGRWLDVLVEREMQRRLWAQLDEDTSSAPAEEEAIIIDD